jgi:hypothetical protein
MSASAQKPKRQRVKRLVALTTVATGTLDVDTGEIALDEPLSNPEPHGRCALGCGHPATIRWFSSLRGANICQCCGLVFICKCCAVEDRLGRAKWWATQVANLEAELAKERESCATKQETPTPADPASA